MRFTLPAILAFALILSPTAAQQPGYVLDQSRGVVLLYAPNTDTQSSTVNALQWSNNSVITRAYGTSPFQNQDYEVPYSYYLLPILSQLSWLDSSDTVHVVPAAVADSMGTGLCDYTYFQSISPHIPITLPEATQTTAPTSPYDLFQKLYGSQGKLCLVIVENDPVALSYAFAEKWFMVQEAVRLIENVYGVSVPPEDVDMCYVVCAETKTDLPNGYVINALIPLVWGASAVTSAQILTELANVGDPFATLVQNAVCAFVVYEHDDFRYLAEQILGPLLSGRIVYLPASLEKIYGSSPEYVIVSPPGPGGPGSWYSTNADYPLYQPWPAVIYLGSVLGVPFVLTAQDLDLLGEHWKGVILVNPKPSEAYLWDEVSFLTDVLPQTLSLGGGNFPNVLETTMQVTMANGKSVNIGAPYFYGGVRITGMYPWDLMAVDITTAALMTAQGHPPHLEWTREEEANKWFGIALGGPYCVMWEAPNCPALYAYKALGDAFVSAVANARDDTWLKDVPLVDDGLYGLFCLATAICANDDPKVLPEETREYRFYVAFGFMPLEDWVQYDKPVAFHVDWPNKDCLAVMCRSSTSPEIDVPYDMASCCDVQAILTEEPYDLEGVTSWYTPSENPEYVNTVPCSPFLPLPWRRRR